MDGCMHGGDGQQQNQSIVDKGFNVGAMMERLAATRASDGGHRHTRH